MTPQTPKVAVLDLLQEIERARRTRFLVISSGDDTETVLDGAPAAKRCGMYWLYTSYSKPELLAAAPARQRAAVDIGRIADLRVGLANVATTQHDGFLLVYNGIGGLGQKRTGGLRERILGEFNGGQGTGSLAIRKTSLSDLSRWRYSWVSFRHETYSGGDIAEQYSKRRAEELEVAWRLQYGWPLLCKR